MCLELNLRFSDPEHVSVHYDGNDSKSLDFESPLDDKALEEIRWYLEVYATHYTSDVDDEAARRIEAKLLQWGEALFEAVFDSRAASRLFNEFQEYDEPGRLLTIDSDQPEILSLPWELLRDPEGTFLCHEDPRISIRRKLSGVGGGRKAFKLESKERLRLLFAVSRPSDAGFIDPRSDPTAVLQAIEKEAAEQVEAEFLRPATIDNLIERLEDRRRPAVDIIHFDGHGVFDRSGDLQARALKSDSLAATRDSGQGAENTGYLLFEDAEGKQAPVSAEKLGDMLHRKKVGLMVLSACQSAKVGGDEPMGSVAARLTHAGIPAVLAMTHSVLVSATRDLFGQFYKHLARGSGIGEALDNARRSLYRHPERGERQRGETRVTLKLQDWFLPALYQAGKDAPLLTPHPGHLPEGTRESHGKGHNLPDIQEAGFFGRIRELWKIERAFVQGTKRYTISGFGGQGKSYLAIEAGGWLQKTGMFRKVCFVDYAAFQGVDAVSMAVGTLAKVLDTNLLDADAATQALRETPTLLILDNLEAIPRELTPRPPLLGREGEKSPLEGEKFPFSSHEQGVGDELKEEKLPLSSQERGPGGELNPLHELLSAAKVWSEAGESRVLLTTRMADHGHPDYLASGTNTHHMLQLKGLGEEDALNYFQSLMKLPPAPKFALPERKSLLELFALVDFHPLSIGLLAQQLKVRRPADLGQRLEELLDAQPENIHDKSLRASLELSLDRLPPEARKWLPRLGVFQGGAMEAELLAITEFSEEEWRLLRPALEQAGLIQAEALSGGRTFLKFHPTLAPALWGRLTPQEQTELRTRHRERYYQLSGYLYHEDDRNPHQVRAIVLRELSNLLAAVRGALQAEEENAVAFVNNVNKFLNYFGLRQDLKTLNEAARQLTVESGSHNWFLSRSNQGEQLYNAGRYSEAAQIFEEILAGLGAELSYEHCVTLNRLGRCFHFQGQAPQAAEYFRRGIAVAGQLEQSDGVKRQSGALQVDLADALRDMGDYAGAREAYQASSTIAKEINELRMEAVANGQLGTLAMLEGNLQEAEKRYQEALRSFQALNETASEAAAWHQLGMLYRRAKDWEAAERAYRESAALEEGLGNLAGAAATWNNLAAVTQLAGKPQEAEGWYRKALEVFKEQGDLKNIAVDLNNLADLLQGDSRPHIHEGKSLRENDKKRLDEAQQMAEEALAISQTLDPGAAAIWTTYNILAEIADQQDDPQQARGYRRQARQTKFAFKGTEHELKQHAELIGAVVATAKDNEIRTQLEPALENLVKNGWGSLVAALRRVLDGGRDEDELCGSLQLDPEDSVIVMAILRELRG